MNNEERGLRPFLQEVSASVVEHLEASLSSGAVFRSSYDTLERAVTDYRYAPGMSELDIGLVPRTVGEWVWRDKSGFMSEVISGCPSLGEGIELIMDSLKKTGQDRLGGDEEEVADRLAQGAVDQLTVFIIRLTDRLLGVGKELYQEVIDQAVEEFLGDLAGLRPGWDFKVFLKCLWMQEGECDLGDGLRLRCPRLEDYAGRTRVEGISWGGLSEVEVERVGTFVGSVLEMHTSPSSEAEAREALRTTMDALLLFRVASISVEHLEASPRSVLWSARLEEEDEGLSAAYHAILAAEDHEDLRTFIREIAPLIRHHAIHRSLLVHRCRDRAGIDRVRQRHARTGHEGALPEEGKEEPEPEARAFLHYRSALLDNLSAEERVARAVNGLEAIYLTGDDDVDRKRAVALRASSLLEGWGHDAIKVAKGIRDGFKVRGELFGGAGVEGVDVEALSDELAEYLRLSLVVALQARRALSQRAFIDATDLLVQDLDLPADVAKVLEGIFVNGSPSPSDGQALTLNKA